VADPISDQWHTREALFDSRESAIADAETYFAHRKPTTIRVGKATFFNPGDALCRDLYRLVRDASDYVEYRGYRATAPTPLMLKKGWGAALVKLLREWASEYAESRAWKLIGAEEVEL